MSGLAYLVALREVREELDLDEEQEELLNALSADLRDQRRVAFRGDWDDFSDPRESAEDLAERTERIERLNEASEKLITAVLEPAQAARLGELRVQFEGLRAFDREPFVDALELTELQREQIADLRRESRDRAATETAVKMSLSEKQLAKWEELKGAEFKFPERRGRFGRRGFRGPSRDDD
jgi:hypothetical protein